jgi:hypothetical protein
MARTKYIVGVINAAGEFKQRTEPKPSYKTLEAAKAALPGVLGLKAGHCQGAEPPIVNRDFRRVEAAAAMEISPVGLVATGRAYADGLTAVAVRIGDRGLSVEPDGTYAA